MKKRVLLLIMCVFAMTAASAQITSVAVVGAGVGGWPGDVGNPGPIDVHQLTQVDADNWILTDLVVTGPGIKLRANNKWDDGSAGGGNWGAPASGPQWPGATAVNAGSSNDIKVGVVPGTYTLTFNSTTGVYLFEGGAPIPKVNMIGSAVVGSPLAMPNTSAVDFEIRAVFLDGTAQFDVDGIVISAGSAGSGVAFEGGPAIPVTAGEWIVKLNVETGAYSFEVPPLDKWAVTGSAIVDHTWGTDLLLKTTDGINYTEVAPFAIIEGGFKFRKEGDWGSAKGCGAPDDNTFGFFPTGAPGGSNINVAADQVGTYTVTFNGLTGEYNFTKQLSTKGFSSANFKVYPNPTQNVWNFASANDRIESIQILDVLGKNVMTVSPKNNFVNVDASSLTRGIYFAKVSTATATETLKLMKN